MKIICLKENLKMGIDTVERIVGKNLNLPILNNILIETGDGFLKLSSTDLEIGMTTQIPAVIEKKGETSVPARVFSSFVSGLPEEKIELESKNLFLNIKCEKYNAIIKGQNFQEFPIIPKIKEGLSLVTDGQVLTKGLSQVIGMCSVSDLRPEFSGVFFNAADQAMKLVATDGFRLAEKTLVLKNGGEHSFIVPAKTVHEVVRIFGDSQEVEIVKAKNQVVFTNQKSPDQKIKTTITSRLIEGDYPSYEAIIPKTSESEVIIKKEEFLNQVKTAGFFSGRINDVKIKFDQKNQEIEVSAQDPELGEAKSRIRAETKAELHKTRKEKEAAEDGGDAEISFNYKFILDGLVNIAGENLTLGLNGYNKAATFRPIEEKDYIYILMPIKPS